MEGSGEEREGLRNRGREGEFTSGEGKKEVILNTQAQSRMGWGEKIEEVGKNKGGVYQKNPINL